MGTGIKLKKTKLPPSHMYLQANQGEDQKILTANPMSHLENQGEDQRLLNKLAICFFVLADRYAVLLSPLFFKFLLLLLLLLLFQKKNHETSTSTVGTVQVADRPC